MGIDSQNKDNMDLKAKSCADLAYVLGHDIRPTKTINLNQVN